MKEKICFSQAVHDGFLEEVSFELTRDYPGEARGEHLGLRVGPHMTAGQAKDLDTWGTKAEHGPSRNEVHPGKAHWEYEDEGIVSDERSRKPSQRRWHLNWALKSK